jgi:hypothetical protein
MSSPAPALPDLSGNLWSHAQNIAGAQRFQFSSECAIEVRSFIDKGVATLKQGNDLDGKTIADAKESIERLVAKMIEYEVQQLKDQRIKGTEATSSLILHESSFFFAFRSLCPIYPFC